MFDNLFTNIEFNSKHHTYRLNGRRLANVSSLVSQVKPPFDADYWANRKAKERGCSPEEIKAEWDAKRQASLDLGNEVHKWIEQILTGVEFPADPYLRLNSWPAQVDQFNHFWQKTKDFSEVVKLEWVVGDADLGVAGTADCLLLNRETGEYHLFDWKTNSKFRLDNRFQTMLYPFNDLDDCELNTSSLQLSLYRLIIEKNTNIEMGHAYIVHLTGTGYQVHQAVDLRKRAEQWLTDLDLS